MSDEIRDQINDIIEGEIQNNINEYIEKEGKGFKGEELKVNVNQEELNKLVKVYKKLNKYRKSSLFAVQNMDNTEKIVSEMIAELKKDTKE
jgi:muconolactone delta-isomerase|tara:strand:+ start:486 stop:758 length:273 start_codon:yes stop_codon:yes gene_type:complete